MNPSWRTSTVVELCVSMREAQDYSAAPILADALQDADCPEIAMLFVLRDSGSPRWLLEQQIAFVYSNESAVAVAWVAKYAVVLGPGGYPGNNQWAIEDRRDDGDLTYQTLMEAAYKFTTTGEESFNSMNWSNASIEPAFQEFWKMYALITGKVFEGETDSFFACDC